MEMRKRIAASVITIATLGLLCEWLGPKVQLPPPSEIVRCFLGYSPVLWLPVHHYGIHTKDGDEFYIAIDEFSDLRSSYRYRIYSGRSRWGTLICEISGPLEHLQAPDSRGNPADIRLMRIYDSRSLRCYDAVGGELKGLIIWKDKTRNHYGYGGSFWELDPRRYRIFIPFLKAMCASGDWDWIANSALFLIRSGDKQMEVTIRRYAEGGFTKYELARNRNSEISTREMQFGAKHIKHKYLSGTGQNPLEQGPEPWPSLGADP